MSTTATDHRARARRVMRDAHRRMRYDPTCRTMRDALRKAWSRQPRRITTDEAFLDDLVGFTI